jgi:hypothetical protein
MVYTGNNNEHNLKDWGHRRDFSSISNLPSSCCKSPVVMKIGLDFPTKPQNGRSQIKRLGFLKSSVKNYNSDWE